MLVLCGAHMFIKCLSLDVQSGERQHLLDTWDESIYEGVKDSEEVPVDPMDQFLMLPDSQAPVAAIQEAPTAEDWSKGIMPDFEDDDEDESEDESDDESS